MACFCRLALSPNEKPTSLICLECRDYVCVCGHRKHEHHATAAAILWCTTLLFNQGERTAESPLCSCLAFFLKPEKR